MEGADLRASTSTGAEEEKIAVRRHRRSTNVEWCTFIEVQVKGYQPHEWEEEVGNKPADNSGRSEEVWFIP
jgi:hypothetical protein